MDISWELFIKVSFNLWIIISLIIFVYWFYRFNNDINYRIPILQNSMFFIYLGSSICLIIMFYYGSEKLLRRITGKYTELEFVLCLWLISAYCVLYVFIKYCKLKKKLYYIELMNKWYFEEEERNEASIVVLTDSRADMFPFLFKLGDKVMSKTGKYMGVVINGKYTDETDSDSTIYYLKTDEGRIIKKYEDELEKA